MVIINNLANKYKGINIVHCDLFFLSTPRSGSREAELNPSSRLVPYLQIPWWPALGICKHSSLEVLQMPALESGVNGYGLRGPSVDTKWGHVRTNPTQLLSPFTLSTSATRYLALIERLP